MSPNRPTNRKHKRISAAPKPSSAPAAPPPAVASQPTPSARRPIHQAAASGAPVRRGWLAGIGLAAIALVVLIAATSGGGPVAPPRADQTPDDALAGIDRTDVQQLMRRGKELYDQNRFDESVRAYQAVIRLAPDNQAAHSNLGSAYYRLQQLDDALASFREAVRLNPSDAEARQNLGAGMAALGDFDAAIAEYLQAVALKPDLAPAHYSLGVLYQETGNTASAIEKFKRFLQLGGDPQLLADAQRRLQALGGK
jgi:tetratricopeptide (TPR) repeat protein